MKTKLLLPGLALVAVLFAGCLVQSIQPLFDEMEYISHPAIVGTWTQKEDGKEKELWRFEADGKKYKLTHTDEKKHTGIFEVAAGKIGTNVFLEFSPGEPSDDNKLDDLWTLHVIAVHTFFKVVMNGDKLVLVAMDVDWLKKHLEENPQVIAHVIQDKRPVLTASTADLKKFVAKYADDEKIFKNEITLAPKK